MKVGNNKREDHKTTRREVGMVKFCGIRLSACILRLFNTGVSERRYEIAINLSVATPDLDRCLGSRWRQLESVHLVSGN